MKNISSFDRTYFNRYKGRTIKKSNVIYDNIDNCKSCLDIGCNKGYIIQFLLDKEKVSFGTGIDLKKEVVFSDLISRDNFSFIEGDIVDIDLTKIYDTIIYLSVHHHIFGKYGFLKSFEVWNKIISHCNNSLFFETGICKEIGSYYWKTNMKRIFINSNSYIYSLLNHIGSRLKKVSELAEIPIHNTKRILYKIDLYPIGSNNDVVSHKDKYFGDLYKESNWKVVTKYHRTKGSKNQKLIDSSESNILKKPIFIGTEFHLLENDNKEKAFSKNVINNPYKIFREFKILSQLDNNNNRFVKPIEVNDKYGLIFPYFNWKKIYDIDFSKIKNKKEFLGQIKSFFLFANKYKIDLGNMRPYYFRGSNTNLINIVDFNISNFIIKIEADNIVDWKVIDMEYCNYDVKNRNYYNFVKIRKYVEKNS